MTIFNPSSNNNEQTNWAGNIRFTPDVFHKPGSEKSVAKLIKEANKTDRSVKVAGARHSCSSIFKTDDILLSLEKFKKFRGVDPNHTEASFDAGVTVEMAGETLFRYGLAMENTGHIDQQTLAGAVSTGTHGAGKHLSNLSGQVTALRLVTGSGLIRSYNERDHPEVMRALRVSIGALGIITQVSLRVLPAFQVHRQHYCISTADCMKHLSELMENNRNFGFYWYPRRDEVSLRLWNIPGSGLQELPYARLDFEQTGWGKDLLPTPHDLRYHELEYSFPIEQAQDCFMEVRERILKKHRKQVGWRVLFRPIAADDNYLSNAYGHPIVAITIHQNQPLPYKEYFADIEQIFQSYGGRPHWGKIHTMAAKELKKCYPEWDSFQRIREEFDPKGVLLTPYLKHILIDGT